MKGIQTVRDAEKCVELGVQGILVSNHGMYLCPPHTLNQCTIVNLTAIYVGGRQVDGCIAALDMLPEIAEAVGDRVDIRASPLSSYLPIYYSTSRTNG